MKGNKKVFLWIFGVGVFLALLWRLDLRQSWEKIRDIEISWLLLSLAIMALTQFCAYGKWAVMYRVTMKEKTQPLLPIYTSILISGMLTPARSGDLLASLAWKKMQGKILAWSIFHRISEGATTIAVSLFVLGVFFQKEFSGFQWAVCLVLFAFIIAGIFVVLNEKLGMYFLGLLKNLMLAGSRFSLIRKALSFEEKVVEQLELFYQTLKEFKKGHALSALVLITLVNRVFGILVNIALLRSLGVSLPVLNIVGILAVTWVGSFLAFTPSGIGLGDIAPSIMLSHMGYQDSAGAFIVMGRLIDVIVLSFWTVLFFKTFKKSTVNSGK